MAIVDEYNRCITAKEMASDFISTLLLFNEQADATYTTDERYVLDKCIGKLMEALNWHLHSQNKAQSGYVEP